MATDSSDSLAARPGTLLLGRAVAAVTVVSAAVHLVGVATHGVLHSAVLVAMASACVRCLPDLWKRPSVRVYGVVALTSLAMLAVHTLMNGSSRHAGGHMHGTAPGVVGEGRALDSLSTVALGCAVLEAALASAAVFHATRTPLLDASGGLRSVGDGTPIMCTPRPGSAA